MPDLRGVRVKIDRAKKHFADLDSAILAYEGRQPYQTEVVKHDPRPGDETHYFRLLIPVPIEWGAILGDCIHNLRSALDLLAVVLVKDGGGVPGPHTVFPINSTRTGFLKGYLGKLNGASTNAIKLVRRLQPYDRGKGDALWRLHSLDIADKHELLIPVAAAHKMLGVQYHVTDAGTRDIPRSPMKQAQPDDRKFPLKDGDVLHTYIRVPLPFQDETKFEFAFEIAFGKGQIFDGQAVIPTLNQLIEFTERFIDIFARRILKISW